MTRQWIRNCRLTLGNSSQTIDLSSLRIRFEVQYATVQSPTVADIIITNPSDQTVNLFDKQFRDVTLEAGYDDELSLIFKGQAKYKRAGRETLTDTYLNLICKSGDEAYTKATVSKTLAAGHTFRDQVNVALKSMEAYGVTAGYIADLGSQQMPRAISLFGMAREVLRRVCIATNTSWTIHNGKVNIVRNDGSLPGDVVVLNSRTGMIGRPIQTFEGIEARCLLNPRIGPGTKIKIDERSIEQVKLAPDWSDKETTDYVPPFSADGTYTVAAVRHIGDTRGGPWYTDMICIRPDAPGYSGLPVATNLAAIPSFGSE